ncbi:hypothetical protein AKL15_11290 [Corynebacterium glutamicum]|nr:hypothetical protein B7P23_00990 [Corynebacterium glutamicum]NII98977.1 hypothetical protein [Corynebacterium glutamicum]OKX85189.1 hypothetical protein AUO96_11930 [Corynebacterium glutamicum]QDX76285.1 hypothetical protein AKL15_11290 [Corynebacterium glutamicum]QDX79060.1 hypothetical protein AKL16_11295 [Corynebacterium glutamicum]
MALHHLQRHHHQHPTQRPPRPPIPTLYQLDPQLPSRTNLANQLGVTRRTLTNWFHDYWFVQVPRNTDRFRVYD